MTFYLKYRPKIIDELDIAEVRDSLNRIVKSGKIPHAFLFAGPKGTGKTSAARIMAKIVNCEKRKGSEPCNKCEQCLAIDKGNNLDVVELDAASHRGIEDARALRDAVKLAPAKAKKKVYIIDEAHMLTTEASNALLKTLEEPPAHVMFILATTNPEKLIETIRSRTTSVSFRKATTEEIVRSLERAVKGEKIKIDKETLGLIAKAAGGSFRDAVKILEQLFSEGKSFSKDKVEEFLFKVRAFDVEKLLDLLAQKNAQAAILEVEGALKKGVGIENLVEALLTRLREALLVKIGLTGEDLPTFSKKDLIAMVELFGATMAVLGDTPIEQLPLEIAIIKWCEGTKGETPSVASGLPEIPKDSKPNPAPGSSAQTTAPTTYIQPATIFAGVKEINEEIWKTILATVKPINTSIEALLRAARPLGFDGKTLTLGVFYRFHKERLEDGRHRRVLEEVVAKVLAKPVRIICQLTEPPARKPVQTESEIPGEPKAVLTEGEDKDIIKIAEEIFGN